MIQLDKKQAKKMMWWNFIVSSATGAICVLLFLNIVVHAELSMFVKALLFILSVISGIQAGISLLVGIDFWQTSKKL